jgi:hypothetical protein
VLGLNARQYQSPPATGVQPRLSAPTKYVPLSQFFLQLNGAIMDGGKKLYGYKEKAVAEARLDLDRIKADIMSDDPLTYGAYSQDDLHGSLKDRIEEIVYNHAYEVASGRRDETSARRAMDAIFALAKKEKFQAVVEKAWRDGLKDGAGSLPAAGKSEATTTATVATTAVPLGMETDKRKLRRGKPSNLSGKIAGLLRRLF